MSGDSITVSSVSFNSTNGVLFTTSNGTFNANDNNINLTFQPDFTTVSDTAGSGYSLTIVNPFQGQITANTTKFVDTATLTGTIEVTTPPPPPNVINNTNPTFAISGILSCSNYSVYADSNKTHLILNIGLSPSNVTAPSVIFANSTYDGVVNFAVTITGTAAITSGNQSEDVTLNAQINPNILYLNFTEIINNASSQILNSASSINNSVNQSSNLVQGLLPPHINIRVS